VSEPGAAGLSSTASAALQAKNGALALALRGQASLARSRAAPERAEGRCRKLFVVGCPRSGTTWVQRLLEAHPSVVSAPESHIYSDLYEPIVARGRRDVRTWAWLLQRDDVQRRTRPGFRLVAWTTRRTMRDLALQSMAPRTWSDEEAAHHAVETVFERHFAARGGTPDELLVEKTPEHIHHAELILDRFPEAKVVEVLRDGRDVCVSLQHHDVAWAANDRSAQIDLWVRSVRRGMQLRGRADLAGRVLLLRYEDLQADAVAYAGRLWDFAGLDSTPEQVEEAVEQRSFARRRRTGPGAFNRKGIVGDWVNEFSDEDADLFRELAGDVFTDAGYEW
jgi:hypothetical protein